MRPQNLCQFGTRLKTLCIHSGPGSHTQQQSHTQTRFKSRSRSTIISVRAYHVTGSTYGRNKCRLVHTHAIDDEGNTAASGTNPQKSELTHSASSAKNKFILASIKAITNLYDVITLPLYTVTQQPWNVLAQRQSPKSILLDKNKNIYGTVIPQSAHSTELERCGVDDLDSLFSHACKKFGSRPCTGVREVISRHESHVNGALVTQYEFGAYKWKSYARIEELATHLGLGLESLGLQAKDKIAIFAETREEWLLTLIAAFKRNLTVVTIFSALDNAGVVHALNETEVSVIFTSNELLDRCKEVVGSSPAVKQIVYMGRVKGEINGNGNGSSLSNTKMNGHVNGNMTDNACNGNGEKSVKIKSLDRVIGIGAKSLAPKDHHYKPARDDTAIIMYTSGSTGIPKGVVISHWNMMTNLMSVMDTMNFSFGDLGPSDVYPAYLPVAHVMELIGELSAFAQGVQIGFSSASTLIDTSPGIQPGTRGDLPVLKPTALPSAPLVLERIMRGITAKVTEKGPLAKSIFDYFHNYKVKWVEQGYRTPILDRILYGRFCSAIGGNVRLVTTGGAPLAAKTHEFIETVLCAPVCISYGMTESSGLGLFSLAYNITPGRVGGPIGGSTVVRLVDWEEGGYRVIDKPNPRGELYIGGENVAHGGYYKRPELEDFFEDEHGTRWVRTGDIAELLDDGGFHVIDRRKDLVKLSTGEYIGLAKVESIFKMHPVIENICIVVDPFESYAVSIVVPAQEYLFKLAAKLGRKATNNDTIQDLCQDVVIKKAVLAQLHEHGLQHKLSKYELPYRIHLTPEPWTPQTGLVTAALKNQRTNLAKRFANEIKFMYA